jgi:hypothetical protein
LPTFGAETSLVVSGPLDEGRKASLLQFDFEQITGAVGDDALDSAALELSIDRVGDSWQGAELRVHAVTAAWTERGATWTCANDTDHSEAGKTRNDCDAHDKWMFDAGDGAEPPFQVEPTGSVAIESDPRRTVRVDVTDAVRRALDGGDHRGWLLSLDVTGRDAWARFDSREGGAPPRLTLEVQRPEPGDAGRACVSTMTHESECNGSDDDCDGTVDEDFVASTTSCGRGPCVAQGQLVCRNGRTTDTCAAGDPLSSTDATCDAVDDDCDGSVDEDFVASEITCGVGGCARSGERTCVDGTVREICVAGAPEDDDAQCDGVDSDCDGDTDEAYGASLTACEQDGCSATGTLECLGGAEVNTCETNPVCVAEVDCADDADNDGDGLTDCDDLDCESAVACGGAPILDRTVATELFSATRFLYEGANPKQTGVAADTIDPRRVALVRGYVSDRQGDPLTGVTVRVEGHPELGQTQTQSDGTFTLVVNGGEPLRLGYRLDGHIPAWRRVTPQWRQWHWADDLVLVRRSAVSAQVTPGAETMQAAIGEMTEDEDGMRRPVVMVPPDTLAEAVMEDGSRAQLSNLTMRTTEFTVGETGSAAMPAALPDSSA